MCSKSKVKRKWGKDLLPGVDKIDGVRGKTPKVLIVEDNVFNVLPIQATLKRNHIEYDLAKNGLMAVDRYNQSLKEG